MSEQEKKSGGAGVSPAVVIEQTTNSRHNPPYKPTEIQEDSDLLHKHSRAPTVPCVAEEIKDLPIETTVKDNVEEKEQSRAKSTEMSKQNVSKKLSSIPKKQSSSPESIALAHLEVDTKKGSNTPPSQPIPQDVEALSGADFTAAEKETHKRGDTDSIAGEIPEGRTFETSKKYSNWNPAPLERREISWKEKDFQGKEILPEIGAKSRAWILERRASVGPCFRPGMPFEGPTGIAIHIPRKSMSAIRPSGININISRKNSNSKSKVDIQHEKLKEVMKESNQTEPSEGESKFISTLKGKLSSVHSKIKSTFHY